jgi:hypothetical protein
VRSRICYRVTLFPAMVATLVVLWWMATSATAQMVAALGIPSPIPATTPAQPVLPDIQQTILHLQSAANNLMVAQIVLGGVVVFLAVMGLVSVTAAREWIRTEARTTTAAEIGKVTGRLYSSLSYIEWARFAKEKPDLTMAILLGEKALELASAARDEETIVVAKTSLAYYYAQLLRQDKKEVALDYARYGRDAFVKFSRYTNLLANDIYVRMRFAPDCDAQTLGQLKSEAEDFSRRFPDLREELEGYIHEMKKKCPALESGASA